MRSIVLSDGSSIGLKQRLMHIFWRLIQVFPDRVYVVLKYFSMSGTIPNLKKPRTFTEKVQVRKLYDRNRSFPVMVDKHAVKELISARVGDEHIIETQWVGRDISAVDWERIKLPVVVKPTHGSGQGVFLEKPEDIDAFLASGACETWLKTRHHRINREWAYGQFEPELIIETMLRSENDAPDDFRFFVFSGKVRLIEARLRRNGVAYEAYYAPSGERLDLKSGYFPPAPASVSLPPELSRMTSIAQAMAYDTDFMRVDLYACEDRILVGELTLYPGGGLPGCVPAAWDEKLGAMWELRAAPPRARPIVRHRQALTPMQINL